MVPKAQSLAGRCIREGKVGVKLSRQCHLETGRSLQVHEIWITFISSQGTQSFSKLPTLVYSSMWRSYLKEKRNKGKKRFKRSKEENEMQKTAATQHEEIQKPKNGIHANEIYHAKQTLEQRKSEEQRLLPNPKNNKTMQTQTRYGRTMNLSFIPLAVRHLRNPYLNISLSFPSYQTIPPSSNHT